MTGISITSEKKRFGTKSLIISIAELFSAVLEEEVTTKQAKIILNVIFAIIFTVLTVGLPLWLNALSLFWLIHAVWLCKRNGLTEK